jgi:hypothetical protein
MGNKSSKQRSVQQLISLVDAFDGNILRRADGKHLYRSNGLYPSCAWNQSQVSVNELLTTRARTHSRHTKCLMERQVKQLVKMGALAPRYPGVSEADEQFNDECPICFFRSELFPKELLSTFIRAAATPPSIVATAAEN